MSLVAQLGLEHPIVQAGMGGGIAGGQLAGAVSLAGALGTVGMVPAAELADELSRAREIAGRAPVSVNLLVPFARKEHVDVCRRARAEAVVLHAGFDERLVAALRATGAFVIHTVGTPEEARRALAEGADGLIVQGREAGGHLLGRSPALEAIEPVLALAGSTPVLLAGGIADGADVRRALSAGAAGVVAGTRFLLTHESGAHPAYKRAVLDARETIETTLFGLGWPMRHRVIRNAATDRWCGAGGTIPAWLERVQRASTPIARLPMSFAASTRRLARTGVPVFGPAPPVAGDAEKLVAVSALYAGETALRIGSVIGAARAVGVLAGTEPGDRSPTIQAT